MILKIRLSEQILHLLQFEFLIQLIYCRSLYILTAVSCKYHILSLLKNVCSLALIIACEVFSGKLHSHGLLFARCQFTGLGEACKALYLFIEPALRTCSIYLDDFASRMLSCILYLHIYGELSEFSLNALCFKRKIRISESVTEREQRLYAGRIKVAVSDIDAFLISCLIDPAELSDAAVVFICSPCGRQLA